MTAAVKVKRPPMFYHTETVDVDVDIDPEDLEAAGWVYVGKDGDEPLSTEHVLDAVRRWHDDNHTDPWIVCFHPLCRELAS